MSLLSQARLVKLPPRQPRIVWAPILPAISHLRETGWEWRQIHEWLVAKGHIPPAPFPSFRIVASRHLSRINQTTPKP